MNREHLYLGPTPCDEQCAQVSDPDYREKSQAECARYIQQLKRQFPEYESRNVRFAVKTESHDFGAYREVVVSFDSRDESAAQYAFDIENNLPDKWVD